MTQHLPSVAPHMATKDTHCPVHCGTKSSTILELTKNGESPSKEKGIATLDLQETKTNQVGEYLHQDLTKVELQALIWHLFV